MFPLQRSDELVPHSIPSAAVRIQQPQIQEDLISGHASSNTTSILSHVQQVNNDAKNLEYKLKRIMHRDVERQRRQEMANLHAYLRSLLPIQYIKGKRSMSDQMHEAVNYIKHLENNIEELQMRRDKLKKLPNFAVESRRLNPGSRFCVTVNQCHGGVEILISNGGHKEENDTIPLSRVLQKLLEEGLSVVSCIYNRDKERSLYRIQTEVSDMTSIDLNKLHEEMADLTRHSFNSDE